MNKKDIKPGDLLKAKNGQYYMALLVPDTNEIILAETGHNKNFKNQKFIDKNTYYYYYQKLSDYTDDMKFGTNSLSIVKKFKPSNLFFEKPVDGLKVKDKNNNEFICYFTAKKIFNLADEKEFSYNDFSGLVTEQGAEGYRWWEERHEKIISYFIIQNGVKVIVGEKKIDLSCNNSEEDYVKTCLLIDKNKNKFVIGYDYLTENYEIVE